MPRIKRIAGKTIALSAVVVLGGASGAGWAVAAEQTLPGSLGLSAASAAGAPVSTPSGQTLALSGPALAGAPAPVLTLAPPSIPQAPATPALPAVAEAPPPSSDPISAPQAPANAQSTQVASRVVSQAASGRPPRDHRVGRRAASGRRAGGGAQAQTGSQRRGQHRPAQRRGPRRGDIRNASGAQAAAPRNDAFQPLALPRFDRLGTAPEYPAPSQLLGSFGDGSSADFTWALQLLAVMLLIGLGGFVRSARLF